jgi:hypothetical protein
VKRKQERKKVDVLAVVDQDDLIDYASRQTLFNTKKLEMLAAGAYLDAIGEELRLKYDLPSAYTLDFQTGEVTAPVEEEA